MWILRKLHAHSHTSKHYIPLAYISHFILFLGWICILYGSNNLCESKWMEDWYWSWLLQSLQVYSPFLCLPLSMFVHGKLKRISFLFFFFVFFKYPSKNKKIGSVASQCVPYDTSLPTNSVCSPFVSTQVCFVLLFFLLLLWFYGTFLLIFVISNLTHSPGICYGKYESSRAGCSINSEWAFSIIAGMSFFINIPLRPAGKSDFRA